MSLVVKLDTSDVLADVIESARLRGRIYCRGDFSAPWSIRFTSDVSHFHIIERGSCWLLLEGESPLQLSAGDLVLIPRGHVYQLSDDPATPATPLSDLVHGGSGGVHTVLSHGGGGAATALVCGAFDARHPHVDQLLAVMPRLIRVSGAEGRGEDWLQAATALLESETRRADEGTVTIVARLTEIIFVQTLRHWMRQQPEGAAGWLGALRDPSIGAALRAMHERPEHPWTVGSLAEVVGMSRSPFARRFTAFVGSPPLAYLASVRMRAAAGLLETGTLSVPQIAERVGYESQAAFSRGFKKFFGVSPGAYRRRTVPG